ncbi:MAG: polymer-forming cytoskeletal protein [Phycisphaeraceae bacterium]|nr:polymer-forming cytoskeletal protein [Phycisphaeraceae bacterium]
MAKAAAPRRVQCYLCRHRFDVSGIAMTVSCPACHKPLLVQDVVVKTLQAVKKLQTCGSLVVERKGRVIAELVEAHGGIEVRGNLQSKTVRAPRIRIWKTATWKGDCEAAVLFIEPGATLEGGYFTVPDGSLGVEDLLAADEPAGAGKGRSRRPAR